MRQSIIFKFFLLFTAFVNVCNAQQGTYTLKFDGLNDNVSIGTPTAISQLGQGSYTIEAWIRTNYTDRQCIVGNYNYNSTPDPRTQSWVLELHSSGNPRMYVNGTACNADPAYTVSDNKWHHIAGVRDNATSSVYIYMDGKLIYSNVGGVPNTGFNVSNNTLIGSNPCTGGYALPFHGSIDEVRIWNTARTEAEIKANMYKEIGTHVNLKAYYKMSNGSGTSLTDDSGNNNTATINNGTVWKASGCLGGSRQALDFDGSNDNISFGYNAPLVLTASVSIEAWVNLTTTAQQCFVAGKIIHGNPNYGYGMYINSGNLGGDPGQITFIAGRSWNDWPSVRSISKLESNKWYHIAATFDGRYLKIFINGILDNVYDRGFNYSMTDSGDNFKIGYNGNLGVNYFAGKIDEVRIWNTSRTETQIRENFLTTLAGNESGLVAYYRMDQLDGATLYDMTSNAINGTLTNMDPATDWVVSTAFNTWVGAEDNSWTNAGNWTNQAPTNGQSFGLYNTSNGNTFAFNSAINYGSIYLSSVNALTLNQGAQMSFYGHIINNGTINIKSNASGDGSLINNVLSGSGTYKVERYLSASKWHLVTSPITNGLSGVFQNIWLRPYDEATNTFGAYIVPLGISMPTGQGFSVWTNSANEIRTFSGIINNGTVTPTVQLTGAAAPSTGWNLVGNPYPSAIDWDAASGWTKTNIANSVYVWNNNQYATYINGTATNGGSRYIAMEQGFFVQATGAGANISMNNNVRVHNSVGYLKNNEEDPIDIIRVKVSKDLNSDEVVIAFRENGSAIFNPQTDAIKLIGGVTSPQMHTSKSDNSNLAINTLILPTEVVGKYVYLDIAETGTHQLLFTHTLTGTNIPRLFDTKTQTEVAPNTSYSFNATVGDANTRFQFIESLPMNIDDSQNNSNFTIWESNDKLFVLSPRNEEIKQISIYTVEGKLVCQGIQSGYDISFLSDAIYFLKITTNKQTFTKKILKK